ncbi:MULTISPECIES: alpha/beta hydrolase [unclassified Bacillus (in: firmicutes)]|uniref:alpha/beta hydrolase n=1 Tax=unclassified Bacillus (in: firmicutes) TaxID=185979 RepID=UPI0008E3E37E|nr:MULTISPECIES: alpha/beta hydrolase-fold protein [unclassified Bacillus (in: firmicutes)]SFA87277.1 Predicted hydrolase of the alpha/beta superfamily [Bacillus sp. UNCCL13]SFQ84151.1 Predicted hydrolase of the alpha/beta superfamily [Bacillus sp. cl95]
MQELFKVVITPFNRERTIRVYLPLDYKTSDKKYPVLYMHDGQNLFRDEDASFGTCWGIQHYLDKSGLDLIVVGIDCDGEVRLDEYAPWPNVTVGKEMLNVDRVFGGEGKQYIDYIVSELKPLIDRTYRTIPEDTSMAGSSMGGLISTYAACEYPHIFKKIASISSAYWFNQDEIEKLIEESDLSAINKFYLDIGTKEIADESRNQRFIESSRTVYDLFKDKVGDSRFVIAEGAEHNEKAWRERVPEIFAYLFEPLKEK